MAPLDRWKFAPDFDPLRVQRLTHPPEAAQLVDRIVGQAEQAATRGAVDLVWRACTDKPGFWRLEADMVLDDEETFDQLFNGRSGYRAQYYRGKEHGESFNLQIVSRLATAVRIAYRAKPRNIRLDTYLRSLNGQWSKIAVYGDDAPYLAQLPALQVPEWVEYWSADDRQLGLRVPLPDPPRLDLKGTFIEPGSGKEWVPDRKRKRSEGLRVSGWDSPRDLE